MILHFFFSFILIFQAAPLLQAAVIPINKSEQEVVAAYMQHQYITLYKQFVMAFEQLVRVKTNQERELRDHDFCIAKQNYENFLFDLNKIYFSKDLQGLLVGDEADQVRVYFKKVTRALYHQKNRSYLLLSQQEEKVLMEPWFERYKKAEISLKNKPVRLSLCSQPTQILPMLSSGEEPNFTNTLLVVGIPDVLGELPLLKDNKSESFFHSYSFIKSLMIFIGISYIYLWYQVELCSFLAR